MHIASENKGNEIRRQKCPMKASSKVKSHINHEFLTTYPVTWQNVFLWCTKPR